MAPGARYLSPKVVAQPVRIGWGLVLRESVARDELLIDFGGHGVRMGQHEAWLHEHDGNHHIVQVDDDLYQVTLSQPWGIDLLNHSCHSNCGMRGSFQIVARRAIPAGEELTLDYALLEMHPSYRLHCSCGHDLCRGTVSGRDWRKSSLQREYAGYFANHIQRRIDLNPLQGRWRDLRESAYWAMKWLVGRIQRR